MRTSPEEDAPIEEVDDARLAWAALASVEGIGPARFMRLVRRFGSPHAALAAASRPGAHASLTREMPGEPTLRFEPDLVGRIERAGETRLLLRSTLAEERLRVVTLEEATYPSRLRLLDDPPPVLFVRGSPASLEMDRAIAIVGTRRPTERGRRLAAQLAAAIGDAGACVVSGLAVGIDGAAHAAAVEGAHRTVAVLGGGHRHLTPTAHRAMARQIEATGGATISELAPDQTPLRGTFPRRNRLISGLSDATIVVEAPLRSGALITAERALEQGRECFVVPGPIDAPQSAGCLALLRAAPGSVRVVTGIVELLEDLGLDPVAALAADARGAPREVPPGPVARALLAGLAGGPRTLDQLVAAADQPVSTVLATLTLLETKGFVTGSHGRYLLLPPHSSRGPGSPFRSS